MDQHPHELMIPGPAERDENAREVLRAWASGGMQHISINVHHWDDPFGWGMLLVDLAKHVANAFEQSGRMSRAAVLERIKQNFDGSWSSQ